MHARSIFVRSTNAFRFSARCPPAVINDKVAAKLPTAVRIGNDGGAAKGHDVNSPWSGDADDTGIDQPGKLSR